MRPKFNTVSSQLDLSCAMLDWRCAQSLILCLLSWTFLVKYWIEDASLKFSSIGPFSFNAKLEMRPKFNTVSSQLDINCICVLNSSSLSLRWTNGPVVACFYYQHLYTRFQTSSCSSIEQSRNCTSAFLSWIFLVQRGFEAASKVFILFHSQSSLLDNVSSSFILFSQLDLLQC